MKLSNKYFFSVEGETEVWYLEWLRDSINASPDAEFKVSFDCKIEKDPISRVKGMSITKKTFVNHIFDRESEEEEHVQQFNKTLKRMKDSQKIGKTITYCLGYSNFAFELWMILHKSDCYKPFNYRHQYLKLLNEAYKEKFISLDEYKSEDNFKKLLKKLILTDVWIAIDRANNIMIRNKMNGYILHEYCGFKYYTVNPSLSVGNIFQNILEESRVPKS